MNLELSLDETLKLAKICFDLNKRKSIVPIILAMHHVSLRSKNNKMIVASKLCDKIGISAFATLAASPIKELFDVDKVQCESGWKENFVRFNNSECLLSDSDSDYCIAKKLRLALEKSYINSEKFMVSSAALLVYITLVRTSCTNTNDLNAELRKVDEHLTASVHKRLYILESLGLVSLERIGGTRMGTSIALL